MGQGDDVVILGGALNSDMYGGAGIDTAILNNYTIADYEQVSSKLHSFENIIFADGKYEAPAPVVEAPVAPVAPIVLLEESFENLQTAKGWHVEKGEIVGDHGVVWDTHQNGLEVQSGIVATSSDGIVHAELDAHHNVSISTTVALTNSSAYTLSIDLQPRDGGNAHGNKDTSDVEITFDGKVVSVDSDAKGNLTVNANDNDVTVETTTQDNGWTNLSITYQNVDTQSAELKIAGVGADDSFGMLIDNIKLQEAPSATSEVVEAVVPEAEVETVVQAEVEEEVETQTETETAVETETETEVETEIQLDLSFENLASQEDSNESLPDFSELLYDDEGDELFVEEATSNQEDTNQEDTAQSNIQEGNDEGGMVDGVGSGFEDEQIPLPDGIC